MVKNLPTKQETWVWSLGRGDTLEEEMTTHSSILAWEILWTVGPVGLQLIGSQKRHALATEQQLLALWNLCVQYSTVNSKDTIMHKTSRNFPSHMAGTLFPWNRKFSFSPFLQSQETTSVGKLGDLCTIGKNVKWCSHYRKQYGDSFKLKIDLPYDPLVWLLDIYPQEWKSESWRDIFISQHHYS